VFISVGSLFTVLIFIVAIYMVMSLPLSACLLLLMADNCSSAPVPPSAQLPTSFRCKKKRTNSVAWGRERTIPTERPPFVGQVSDNVCGTTWSAWRIPYGRNFGFLDRSRYFFFKEAPQLYSRGWIILPDTEFTFRFEYNNTTPRGAYRPENGWSSISKPEDIQLVHNKYLA
jgi:hypothetical protein